MLFCSMEFGNQYHDTSMMHINQTGGKHLKKSILSAAAVMIRKSVMCDSLLIHPVYG